MTEQLHFHFHGHEGDSSERDVDKIEECIIWLLLWWLSSQESACSAGDVGSVGLGRSPGEGNGNPLQYSCLGNPMDERAWQAAVHGVTKSHTGQQLNNSNNIILLG